VVFHLAGVVRLDSCEALLHNVNVVGTRNVLNAAVLGETRRFILASSVTAVLGAGAELAGASEEQVTYPKRWASDYGRTKAESEMMVLQANQFRSRGPVERPSASSISSASSDGDEGESDEPRRGGFGADESPELRSVALRFPLVYGVGERLLVEPLITGAMPAVSARCGRQSVVYIDNAVRAFLDAEAALRLRPRSVAGRAFFVCNTDPVDAPALWLEMLRLARRPPPRTIPLPVLYVLALLSEFLHWLTAGAYGARPFFQLTRSALRNITQTYWFRHDSATRAMGYKPRVSTAESIRVIAAEYLARPL
jgi:nucleoside-diphosphate-sugar epimerase